VVARATLPAAGLLAGMLVGGYIDGRDPDTDSSYWLAGAAIGMVGGGVSSLILDYAVFSAADPAPAPSRMAFGVTPRSGGMVLSLGGSF
jgi:hypothetical protein